MSTARKINQDIYIPLLHDEEADLSFSRTELERVVRLWWHGHCVKCIARTIKRDADMVMILVIDLLRTERIKERKGRVSFWGLCPFSCPGYIQNELEEDPK